MGCHSSATSGSIGAPGTGVTVTLNKKTYNYYVSADGSLRDIVSGNKINKELSGEETVKRMIDSGKGSFLTKSEVDNIRKKRLEDRANTPDYEMGNPFNERGRAKRIYRPRRQR